MDRKIEISKLESERSVYRNELNQVTDRLQELAELKFSYENQQVLIKAIYGVSKTQLDKIEKLCSVALRDIVFDATISFKIKLVETKKGVDTYFYTVNEKGEESDVLVSEAGGIKNILSVCLRLIFTELCTPKVAGPIIFDEAGSNISKDYQKNFAEFLKLFSEMNKRQIILISHVTEYIDVAPKHVTVTKREGQAYIS